MRMTASDAVTPQCAGATWGRRVLAIALCAVTLIGCSSTTHGQGSTAPGNAATDRQNPASVSSPAAAPDPDAILRARPSFEDAQRQYLAALTDTANQVAALGPGLAWKLEENSWRGCGGEFLHTKGVQAYLVAVFDGPVSDPLWPRALRIVEDAATRLGATQVQPFVDRPGNHDVVALGPEGIEVAFGTAAATVLSMTSKCRLRQ